MLCPSDIEQARTKISRNLVEATNEAFDIMTREENSLGHFQRGRLTSVAGKA